MIVYALPIKAKLNKAEKLTQPGKNPLALRDSTCFLFSHGFRTPLRQTMPASLHVEVAIITRKEATDTVSVLVASFEISNWTLRSHSLCG